MARKSKGRGTAATFGLLLLLAGLVGGGMLYILSVRRPTQAVEGFARAPVGCTTTLEFSEIGVFYVFEEIGPEVEIPEGDCEPTADPALSFAFEMSGPDGPVVPRADDSLSYDAGDYVGSSVARFEIEAAGEYEIVVVGDDPSAAAAVGRDPDDGVDELRQRGITAAIVGGVLGLLLLVLAGRRSKKANEYLTPDGPGWSLRATPKDEAPVGDADRTAQQPVNPHAPAEQVSIAPDLDQIDTLLAQTSEPKPATAWAPPAVDGVEPPPAPPPGLTPRSGADVTPEAEPDVAPMAAPPPPEPPLAEPTPLAEPPLAEPPLAEPTPPAPPLAEPTRLAEPPADVAPAGDQVDDED